MTDLPSCATTKAALPTPPPAPRGWCWLDDDVCVPLAHIIGCQAVLRNDAIKTRVLLGAAQSFTIDKPIAEILRRIDDAMHPAHP